MWSPFSSKNNGFKLDFLCIPLYLEVMLSILYFLLMLVSTPTWCYTALLMLESAPSGSLLVFLGLPDLPHPFCIFCFPPCVLGYLFKFLYSLQYFLLSLLLGVYFSLSFWGTNALNFHYFQSFITVSSSTFHRHHFFVAAPLSTLPPLHFLVTISSSPLFYQFFLRRSFLFTVFCHHSSVVVFPSLFLRSPFFFDTSWSSFLRHHFSTSSSLLLCLHIHFFLAIRPPQYLNCNFLLTFFRCLSIVCTFPGRFWKLLLGCLFFITISLFPILLQDFFFLVSWSHFLYQYFSDSIPSSLLCFGAFLSTCSSLSPHFHLSVTVPSPLFYKCHFFATLYLSAFPGAISRQYSLSSNFIVISCAILSPFLFDVSWVPLFVSISRCGFPSPFILCSASSLFFRQQVFIVYSSSIFNLIYSSPLLWCSFGSVFPLLRSLFCFFFSFSILCNISQAL